MEQRDWKPLEDQALWVLAHADQAQPREPLQGMALQLRLWRYRASGMHVSWSIILPVREYREKRGVVREASWDRSLDWKRRMSPTERLKSRQVLDPSVRVRDAELGWEDLAPFLDTAGGLGLSAPSGDAALSAPADTFGLEGSRSFAHVRLEWSGRGPSAWALTIAWFERFRKLLERSMDDRKRGSK